MRIGVLGGGPLGLAAAYRRRHGLPGEPHRHVLAEARARYFTPLASTSQFEFLQSVQLLPVNMAPAFLSPLSCHAAQLHATLANSPPPG